MATQFGFDAPIPIERAQTLVNDITQFLHWDPIQVYYEGWMHRYVNGEAHITIREIHLYKQSENVKTLIHELAHFDPEALRHREHGWYFRQSLSKINEAIWNVAEERRKRIKEQHGLKP